ncbi:Conidial yellow pigment biosynthesis polyketide synthase [Cytospora mali]|uniref:Conidial yellow pigment biosynthesis polyketide synthase n=1 Tax=Cytospora mali TaxID=578113 RepID=A0A194V7W9_CYTMA|nr:Conidial yellow pigment biosynthesis polyketide synthase [Valsa mali var. pyri (nom. inval.)]
MSVPVFLDTNTDAGHLLRQWVRLYHYGNIYNACHMRDHLRDLCVHGTGQPWVLIRYALAAATPLAMVPFTWLVMAPTNNALFGLEASSASGSEGGSISPDLEAQAPILSQLSQDLLIPVTQHVVARKHDLFLSEDEAHVAVRIPCVQLRPRPWRPGRPRWAAAVYSHKMNGCGVVTSNINHVESNTAIMKWHNVFITGQAGEEKGGEWTVLPYSIDSVVHLASIIINILDANDSRSNSFPLMKRLHPRMAVLPHRCKPAKQATLSQLEAPTSAPITPIQAPVTVAQTRMPAKPVPVAAPTQETTEADRDSTAAKAMALVAAEGALDPENLRDEASFAELGVDSTMSLVIAEKSREQLDVTKE